ncbi:Glycoside hydrolase family 43 [Macrophomina phaseolina MS6]|uniref:Glycoside hydrolase family 43 n=1 Tax=Macrophomina phaseolina (strain MS6) TaxID=1126212 RepID=K2S2A2_MACPH|nr:Glycoside hydrolase family 43 [Macrophomina phaseolina MS6]
MISKSLLFVWAAIVTVAVHADSYINPVLPGFHPDPSCIYVEEQNQTFFCATSSFSVFPGIPIHASRDLTNWKLASNVLNRRSQLPEFASTPTGQDGIFAPTLRYNNGTFYLITSWVSVTSYQNFKMDNIIFTTTDPFNSASWSDPTHFDFLGYDPSLFWDTDGVAYLTGARATTTGTAIALAPFDPSTGAYLGKTTYPYNGTGIGTPEGPHLYHNTASGWYYLLIAEGGTAARHRGSIARSRSVAGPYEDCPHNPVVHAASNASLIQSVGHADIFQDGNGQWWGVALAQRAGGRGFESVPMGRETVLFPVQWSEDGWLKVEGEVEGVMEGPLPRESREGVWHDEPDIVDFEPGMTLPPHFVHVRVPVEDAYVVGPLGREGSLELVPSVRSLSTKGGGNTTEGTTFVGRRQVDTLFTYSVDLEFDPRRIGDEAGVTVYLDETRHIDLGVLMTEDGGKHLRLRAVSSNHNTTTHKDINAAWPSKNGKARLEIRAANITHYTFSAGISPYKMGEHTDTAVIGCVEASLVTGGYTGTLIGTYATSNAMEGKNTAKAYVSRWRYQGQGQEIGNGHIV